MSIPLSDISSNELTYHMNKAAEHLTEMATLAPVAGNIQNAMQVSEMSQMAFLLTLCAKHLAEGDVDRTTAMLSGVIEQLQKIVDTRD